MKQGYQSKYVAWGPSVHVQAQFIIEKCSNLGRKLVLVQNISIVLPKMNFLQEFQVPNIFPVDYSPKKSVCVDCKVLR